MIIIFIDSNIFAFMQYEKYEDIIANAEFLEYEFTSIGPKGSIAKIVQFNSTNNPDIFNLAFGNKMKDGSVDDLAKDNNKDRNKILTTIVFIVKLFFEEFPDKWVVFSGSTIERTRLYRMAISINYRDLSKDFEIFGIILDEKTFMKLPFEKGMEYQGFLIKKK